MTKLKAFLIMNMPPLPFVMCCDFSQRHLLKACAVRSEEALDGQKRCVRQSKTLAVFSKAETCEHNP
jgi:hypothetical protein